MSFRSSKFEMPMSGWVIGGAVVLGVVAVVLLSVFVIAPAVSRASLVARVNAVNRNVMGDADPTPAGASLAQRSVPVSAPPVTSGAPNTTSLAAVSAAELASAAAAVGTPADPQWNTRYIARNRPTQRNPNQTQDLLIQASGGQTVTLQKQSQLSNQAATMGNGVVSAAPSWAQSTVVHDSNNVYSTGSV